MTRSRETATRLRTLVMLNWRGVFYEPFDMDPMVTALEGENGAGKTATMIAALVGLIPDRNLLQFHNDAEAQGTKADRGLFGRLGEDKGPTYSVLDFDIAGRRVLVGAQLKPGAYPNINLERFIATGVPLDHPLQDLLVVREIGKGPDGDRLVDSIPDLPEIQERVASVGGELKRYPTMKAYGEQLFELGIVPVRLDNSNERRKFHHMLKTSMEGGLSRDIQKSLRDYLLGEDTGLRSRVKEMRDNLDQCRITRRKVQETLAKRASIEEILGAGFGMFEAGFHAIRIAAEEARQAVLGDQAALRQANGAHEAAEQEVKRQAGEYARLQEELEAVKVESGRAAELHARRKRARELSVDIERIQPRRDEALDAVKKARDDRGDAAERHGKASGRQSDLYKERADISEQRGDAQKAWEEVSRKAGLHNQAVRKLEDAREALPDHNVAEGTIPELIGVCEREWREAQQQMAEATTQLEQVDAQRARFQTAFDALTRLAGQQYFPSEAGAVAREVDQALRDKERAVQESQDLPKRIKEAEDRAKRQRAVRDNATGLAEEGWELRTGEEVRAAYRVVREELEKVESDRSQFSEDLLGLRNNLDDASREVQALAERDKAWRSVHSLVRELEERAGASLSTKEAIEGFREQIRSEQKSKEIEGRGLREELTRLQAAISELEHRGGRIDDVILSLSERLESPLVAERFDDVPEAEAAEVEARLGPLHGALLVDDVGRAAERVARLDGRPDTVWLIPADRLAEAPPGTALRDSVLVQAGEAWRLSRKPEHPVVGQEARRREIERLRAGEAAMEASLEEVTEWLASLNASWEKLEGLYRAGWHLVGSDDPGPALVRARERVKAFGGEVRRVEELVKGLGGRIQTLRRQAGRLGGMLPDADLLDEDDAAARVARLREAMATAETSRKELSAAREDWAVLKEGLLDLERVPPSDDELAGLAQTVANCSKTLAYWGRGRDLLRQAQEVLHHLQYADQCALLDEKKSVFRHLEERAERVEEEYKEACADCDLKAKEVEEASKRETGAEKVFNKLDAELKVRQDELERTGEDGSEEKLREVELLVSRLRERLKEVDGKERAAGIALAEKKKEVEAAGKVVEEAKKALQGSADRLRPVWRGWRQLRRAAKERGVLARVESPKSFTALDGKSRQACAERAAEERGKRRTALSKAEESESVLAELATAFPEGGRTQPEGVDYLTAWLAVRCYLARSIPRDLVETDNPERALEAMTSKLASLRDKLDRQENQLRVRSDSVANHISSEIRKERNRIRRISERLEDVSFGSIESVSIDFQEIETTKRLLDTVRRQRDLFSQVSDDESLESILAKCYEKVGGGKIRGEELLDYRRYVQLSIMVRRKHSDRWEPAGAGLSNGESIGVGAAVLMVIQESWEHQNVMLRGRNKNHRSLRFLFLDEAARLSQVSLLTLADFCDEMDMQLLVAAPIVDRAYRGRVFTLVRDVVDGRERVFVRGRRIVERHEAEVANA